MMKKTKLSPSHAISKMDTSSKLKYKLEELVSQCDLSAPYPKELIDWDAIELVGNELYE